MAMQYNLIVLLATAIYLQSYTKGQFDRPEGSMCVEDGINGTCYNIHRCRATVIEFEAKRKIPQICSFEDDVPVVCCTDCPISITPRDQIPPPPPEPKVGDKARQHCYRQFYAYPYRCITHTTHDNYVEFDNENMCYKAFYRSRAPVGGSDSPRLFNPHMVLLGYGGNMESAVWLCSGSIISPRFILTAAHCTYDRRLGPVKFVGSNIYRRSDPYEEWHHYNVKNIYNHPEYHPPVKYHDIALLETVEKIYMDLLNLPACLPYEDVTDTVAYATGWGANTTRGALFDALQRVDLEKFTDDECSAYYPVHRNLKNGYDKETQMCYGHHTELRDTCPGDSGGPLQVQHANESCAVIIIGVTSYGKACGSLGEPGMYTRVVPYLHWIESIVWPGYVGIPREGVDD